MAATTTLTPLFTPGPLSTKIATNYAPTEGEIADIRRFLKEPLAKAAALGTKIDEERARLQELVKQKEALMEATKDHRALVSPLHRLPDELLQHIFVSSLAQERNPTMSATEAPTLLTRVSSHWRHVALSTPRLWAAIHIPIPPSTSTDRLMYLHQPVDEWALRRRLKGVSEWIARSGGCPLDFSVYEQSWGLGMGEGGMACGLVLAILLPAAYRWRDVSFTANLSSLGRPLKGSDVPSLRSLQVKLTSRSWNGGVPWWGMEGEDDSILCAPSLASLALVVPEEYTPHTGVAYAQLTSLTLESGVLDRDRRLSSRKARYILRQCLVLEELTLQTGSSESASHFGVVFDDERFEAVSLPRLKQLALHEDRGQDSILITLNVPALCSLEYSCDCRDIQANEPWPVVQFVERHRPVMEIETFTTSFQSMTIGELMACLQLFPLLKTLRVESSSIHPPSPINFLSRETAHVKDEFLALMSTGGLCPKLEDVKLTQDGYFSEDAVVNFVRNKQQGGPSKLPRLAIVMGKKRNRRARDIKLELSGYIEAGLKLDVFYIPDSFGAPLSVFNGLPLGSVDS